MKCLIIAAGKGSRLQQRGESKPLIPILGIPLIERVIHAAMEAGAEEFCSWRTTFSIPTRERWRR